MLFPAGHAAAQDGYLAATSGYPAAPAVPADVVAAQGHAMAVNSSTLASLIPGARLTLFPGAGHAFLFQDQVAFASQMESFLR